MMKVIKIQGIKEDTNAIRKELEIVSQQYPVFILNSEKPLYEFIEELELGDSLLFRLKIAKEIDFADTPVVLNDRITDANLLDKVTSLSNLLEQINLLEKVDGKIINSCRLVIDTKDNSLISEFVQAFIYLDINLEVMMKKEITDRKLFNAFRKQYDKIRNSVVNGEKALYNFEAADEFLEEKGTLLHTLNDIEYNLEKARERDLNVSVMATKKAGKSVVVNSFLNEQYAPTSLELPTPNTCIYKKSKDDNIRMLYGGKDILFKNAEDVYKYTYKEFKKAQRDRANGYTIDDMEIYYNNSNNELTAFTVVDTPGSNYALARDAESGENIHKKITYQWVQKSDVVLFLINYSNYLTIDEEEFFKNIKSEFEKHDKFYSLVVVVNKLDEMFISECENKSVVRFLDYIRNKLMELGYKDFIVMGTSARSYYDTLKVSKIDSATSASLGEKVPIGELKGSILRARIKNLKKHFIGQDEMRALSFIDDQLERLECFYGLDNYDLDTLRDKSGMPNLVNYTRHIAVQKAYLEVYGLLIRSIDEKFVKIRNSSVVNNLMACKQVKSEQIREISEMLENIISSFKYIELDMKGKGKLSFDGLMTNLSDNIEKSLDKRLTYISNICEDRVDEFFMKLMVKQSEQLKKIKNKAMDIDLYISNRFFNEEMDKITEDFLKELNEELDKKHKYIKDAEGRMKGIVQTFSEIIKKEYDLKDFNINVPKISQDYKNSLIVRLPSNYNPNSALKEKIIDSIEIQETTMNKLLGFFMGNRNEVYAVNSRQLQGIKEVFTKEVKNSIMDEYRNSYDLLRANLTAFIDDNKQQLEEQFNTIKDTYQNIVEDILKGLTESKASIEHKLASLEVKLQFFRQLDSITSDFVNEWSSIRELAV
jgi:hypothetical protein